MTDRTSILRTVEGQPNRILHGADYNPDQWLDSPDVLREDIRLMKQAHITVVSLGIFSWSVLEPEEGRMEFGQMDHIVERLAKAGVAIFLATPTGARPAWMSQRYPEVLRVRPNRIRNLHGGRHNHCYTSPIYREKTRIINSELSRRYGGNSAVQLWHISNEYGGECHCPLCQSAFREWLRRRYDDDLDALNKAWWTTFWSHTFTEWEQIESPAPHGEMHLHGLNLDWKRFVTHQTRDFMRSEIAAVHTSYPEIPVTTNLMGFFPGVDYFKIGEDLDVVSWDSYPTWGEAGDGSDWRLADEVGAAHDLMRSCGGGKPFLLMESTPSMTNWSAVARKKRPGLHLASSMLAVAHGSDSVQYFQWRKSRGSVEKLHGAVVDHVGHDKTRVFADVAHVGSALKQLAEVAGSSYPADVAILFDWENMWALDDAKGPLNDERLGYVETVTRHHHAFTRLSVQCDVIDSEQAFDQYSIVVAPMLYMIKPGVADRLRSFVSSGGTLVGTYLTGIANGTDLCFLGGFPGSLMDVFGIWSEEIDALYPGQGNTLLLATSLETTGSSEGTGYPARDLCDLIHLRGATALATYGEDFYAGRPALTRNEFGEGAAYYIAARSGERFLRDLYASITAGMRLARVYEEPLCDGLHATMRRFRGDDGSIREYRFLINFGPEKIPVPDVVAGETIIYRSPAPNPGASAPREPSGHGDTHLPGYGIQVRRRVAPGN